MSGDSAMERMRAWWLFLVRLAVLVGMVYLTWRIKSVLTTLIVSGVLACAVAALVRPICQARFWRLGCWEWPILHYAKPFIHQHHNRRTLAALLVFVLLAVALTVSVQLLVHPFQAEYAELSANWPTYQKQLMETVDRLQKAYGDLPLPVRDFLEKQQKTSEVPGASALPSLLGTTVSWASHIVELILLPVLAFYFVVDGRSLKKEFLRFIPKEKLRTPLAILQEGSTIMRAYLIAQFWLAVIAGVFVWLLLAAFKMKYAVILAIIAGVTRVVPVIGPLLGGVPVVTLAFVQATQQNDHRLWIGILVAFTCLHLFESKILMPKFLGQRLHLHAVIVIVALLLGGEFFGLLGMFLAAPIAALARALLMHYYVYPRQKSRRTPRKPGAHAEPEPSGAPRLARAIKGRTTPHTTPATQPAYKTHKD